MARKPIGSRTGVLLLLAGAALHASLLGCGGGGGGGSSSTGARVALVDITFPDPSHQSGGDESRLPNNAPLIQRVVLTFSGPVDANDITQDGIELRNAETREQVAGAFAVDQSRVIFHPALPTRPIVSLGQDLWDVGGAGLQPSSIYELTVPLGSAASMPSLTGIDASVYAKFDYEENTKIGTIGRNFAPGTRAGTLSVRFRTTRKQELFLTGYETAIPGLVSTAPLNGSSDLSPKLFTDPAKLFPSFSSYRLVFDQPLDPALDNVSDATFKLHDVDGGIDLGGFVTILANEPDRCEVELVPSGILPFGHHLALSIPRGLRQISGGSSGHTGDQVVTEFDVAADPGGTIRDRFVEDFHSTDRQETAAAEVGEEVVLADWDRNDSNALQSAFGFTGGGELGPFLPMPPNTGTRTILLDTNVQPFPLFDGSTPGAKPGTVVRGGVFNFTDVLIPAEVIVRGIGRNPLVLTATGSVSIAGVIDVRGRNGNTDQSYDSAITPTPGGVPGPGGGRGGVGHPTIIDLNGDFDLDGKPDGYNIMNFLPPSHGEQGFGPVIENGKVVYKQIGGRPGQCGIKTNPGLNCNPSQAPDNDNGSRGAGGGGGTFLTKGARGKNGVGTLTSAEKFDAKNTPIFAKIPEGAPQGGQPGDLVFTDADPADDFFGAKGEYHTYFGGQGGGGAGSRLDSYFCGTRYGGFPETVVDSKGGGGGGGGGVLVVRALGTIRLLAVTGQIDASGGWGGTGEQIGCSNWGGGAGGGAGGLVVLESATMVTLDDTNDDSDSDCSQTSCDPQCDVDISVYGGEGGYVVKDTGTTSGCTGCNMARNKTSEGAGGRGGDGIVQLMVPPGYTPEIGPNIFIRGDSSVVKLPPAEITPLSVGQSTWIDVGRVIQRSGNSPTWSFTGTDPSTGYVVTDAAGNIPDPDRNSFKIDLLPVLDPITGMVIKPGQSDFIPDQATVRIEFQAGDAVEPGSREVATSSLTPWSPVIDVANGHQFLRYRVTFNIADIGKVPDAQLSPDSRLSTMRFVKLPFDF